MPDLWCLTGIEAAELAEAPPRMQRVPGSSPMGVTFVHFCDPTARSYVCTFASFPLSPFTYDPVCPTRIVVTHTLFDDATRDLLYDLSSLMCIR